MQREKFSSRLGFLLISAGCAIGLGNVWRFPYITGTNGFSSFNGTSRYGNGAICWQSKSEKHCQIF